MSITVAELRALLAEQPPDAVVIVSGCECNNPASGVTYRDGPIPMLQNMWPNQPPSVLIECTAHDDTWRT